MNFLGGALPNVMFIIGILAIGLGLGIELKLVPLNKEIDKTGRVGAIIIGAVLVVGSIFIYLNPSFINQGQPARAVDAAVVPVAVAPSASAPATVAAAIVPSAISATTIAAPAAPAAPTATPIPTEPPTATFAPTVVRSIEAPSVIVPDLHGMTDKDVQHKLQDAGLTPQKTDKCSGTDQSEQKMKKGRVQCQNPAAAQSVAAGTIVEYVVAK